MGKISEDSGVKSELKEVAVRPPIDDILKKHKLSIDDLIKCAKEGLQATRDSREMDEEGDRVQVPDHNVRHKYLDSMLNILGYLKPAQTNVTVVQISSEERELIEAYKKKRT